MATALGFDAAFCPDPVPTSVQGEAIEWCEVYIGGTSAYHVWDGAELARVAHLPKLPVWVPTPGLDNPQQAAQACLAALRVRGVPAYASPVRKAVMVDLETGQAATSAAVAWLGAFRNRIHAAGYYVIPYADREFVFGYPAYCGRIMACWDDSPDYVCAGEGLPGSIIGKQFAAEVRVPGGYVDLDVCNTSVLGNMYT